MSALTAAPLADGGKSVDGIDPGNALQILPPNPDRGLWLVNRRRGIGGSDVSALVGLSQYTSKFELWEDKTGKLPLVDQQSEEAEMGTLLEPVVRDRFARVCGLTVRPCGMLQSQRWPWMLTNPDGLVSNGYGYEGKTCSLWKAHEWGTTAAPTVADHAELQSQWNMAVTGYTGWHVACLIGGQRNVYRFVERDDELIEFLVDLSRSFWFEHVLADVPPPVDGSAAVSTLLVERYNLARAGSQVDITTDEWEDLSADRERAKESVHKAKLAHDEVKNRVRQIMGDAEELYCGEERLATWRHTQKFAESRFRKENPDIAEKYVTTVEAIDVEKLAAERPDLYRQYCSRELRFTD